MPLVIRRLYAYVYVPRSNSFHLRAILGERLISEENWVIAD